MKFYLCEILHKTGNINIAIPVSEVRGISNELYEAPEELSIFGFALYEEFLYPIVTHSDIENPVFKFFLILKEYAFGITRILEEIEATPTPFSPSVPVDRDKQFERISEYTGAINHEGKIYYVYNLYYVTLPKNATVVKKETREAMGESKRERLTNRYIIIGKNFAVPIEKVKTILSADLITPFKTLEFDGFIDFGKTIPVKDLDGGKFVVILEDIGYRTSKLELLSGNILTQQATNERYLETPSGTYKILSN